MQESQRAVPEPIRAAVLVPLQLRADGDHVVTLTRRSMRVSHHPGQIAFPGGRFEHDRDESLVAAALREAHEEIGLAPEDVRLLGALLECRTLSSNFLISPFVGVVRDGFEFQPAAEEVEEVFGVPLRRLQSERTTIEREFSGRVFTLPAVRLPAGVVWGATLRIIDQLGEQLPRLLGE